MVASIAIVVTRQSWQIVRSAPAAPETHVGTNLSLTDKDINSRRTAWQVAHALILDEEHLLWTRRGA